MKHQQTAESGNALPSKWFQGQKYLKEQILADAEDQVVVAPGEGKPVGPWRMEKEVAPPVTQNILPSYSGWGNWVI